MTERGVWRRRYSNEVEAAPSMFREREAYLQWCVRADAWAAQQPNEFLDK